jgi:cytochrome c-type biogenesis protein CcmE
MTELSWGKVNQTDGAQMRFGGERLKFIIGSAVLLVAVVVLIASGTMSGARYFISVNELVANAEYVGKTVRISGAVIGDTISYDGQNLILDFTIVNIPTETTDLALTLHQAVSDPTAQRLPVHLENEVMPDLLQHEAQAILTGELGSDGIFYASELLLKCPSRYEDGVPQQSVNEPGSA